MAPLPSSIHANGKQQRWSRSASGDREKQDSDNPAGREARQHNGNVYNTKSNHYTIQQKRSDDPLRAQALDRAFLKAAAEGQTRRLEVLHENGAEIDSVDENGMTSLHLACFHGFEDTVELLLEMGADVNSLTQYGTPLCLAALKSRRNVVEILASNRATLAAEGGLLGSALHAACVSGDAALVDRLIDLGCSPQLTRVFCQHATNEAREGRFDTKPHSCEYSHLQPLHVAAAGRRLDVVQSLLRRGVVLDARYKIWKIVQTIDATNSTVTEAKGSSRTTYPAPVAYSHREILSALLHNASNADLLLGMGLILRESYTASMHAAHNGHGEVLKLLVDAGASMDSRSHVGRTALSIAVSKGRRSCVEILVRTGANLADHDQDESGYTPLHWAVEANHLDVLKVLVDADAPLELKMLRTGVTALSLAALYNRLDCIEVLLSGGADASAREDDPTGSTPLHRAVLKDRPSIVKVLVGAGAPLEDQTLDKGRTALSLAASYARLECMQILIEGGADLTGRHCDFNGWTPLHWAVDMGLRCIVQTFISVGAGLNSVNNDGNSALLLAIRKGEAQIAQILIEGGTDLEVVDHNNDSALLLSIKKKRMDIVWTLIAAESDIDAVDQRGDTALLLAAKSGQFDLVQSLIAAGADVNQNDRDGNTPLLLAAKKGYLDIIQELFRADAAIDAKNTKGDSLLSMATGTEDTSIVKALLDAGAIFDGKNKDGDSLLLLALGNRELDLVDTLVEAGARFNAKENHTSSLLLEAASTGGVRLVASLIGGGVPVETRDQKGNTPLLLAAREGDVSVVRALVDRGANIDAKNKRRNSALMLAASANQIEVVEELIASGKNLKAFNGDSRNAKALAKRKGHEDIVRILKQAESRSKRIQPTRRQPPGRGILDRLMGPAVGEESSTRSQLHKRGACAHRQRLPESRWSSQGREQSQSRTTSKRSSQDRDSARSRTTFERSSGGRDSSQTRPFCHQFDRSKRRAVKSEICLDRIRKWAATVESVNTAVH